MPSYYKNARRWERENRSSGSETLTFARDKSSGEFKLPPQRTGGSVPSAGPKNPGISGLPTSPAQPYKNWKDLPSGGTGSGALPKWRGMAGGMLGFIMDNADDIAKWDKDTWRDFMEEGKLPPGFDFLNPSDDVKRRFFEEHFPGTPVPGEGSSSATIPRDQVFETPDGKKHAVFADMPLGSPNCNDWADWHPGRQISFGIPPTYLAVFGTGSNDGGCARLFGGLASSTWGGWEPHWGIHTNESLGGQPIGNGAFWKSWKRPDNYPAGRTPAYRAYEPNETVPETITVEGTQPTFTFMPGVGFSGYEAPDLNARVPMRYAPYFKTAQILAGNRFDSGYNPDKQPWEQDPGTVIVVPLPHGPGKPPPFKPPVITKPKPPYKPPGSKRDRKAIVQGRALFQAVQKGFHAITEYDDFIESFYDALPKKYQTCKVGGPACKTAKVLAHWDEVDIPTAVVNWLWNNFEDAVLGRGFNQLDKAARNLGTRDWKLLNGSNESPLDSGLGELYGEFVKDHVNPTKEQFVSWAKENLL